MLASSGPQQARHKELPRLDQLSGEEHEALRKASTVVVLLHGLFSTDRGTFDGFIDRLRHVDPVTLSAALQAHARDHADAIVFGAGGKEAIEERFKQHLAAAIEHNPESTAALALRNDTARKLADRVAVVGWPHDTLTSIRANAGELADLIDRVFAGMAAPPRIVFVAHSRGGLVARATAVELLSSPAVGRWRDALSGIVTFGTPHDGAALAEHDARGLATYLLLAQSTGRVASIGDVLTYLDARTAEGLENLKPVNAVTESREQSFVDRLYERERGLRDAGGHRYPPIIAVGGRLDDKGRDDWRKRAAGALVDRWLDEPDHDLVVELTSSTSPRTLPDVTMTVVSSHFDYFTAPAATHDWAFDIALASIWSTVDLATALANISHDRHAPEKAMFPLRLKRRRRARTARSSRSGGSADRCGHAQPRRGQACKADEAGDHRLGEHSRGRREVRGRIGPGAANRFERIRQAQQQARDRREDARERQRAHQRQPPFRRPHQVDAASDERGEAHQQAKSREQARVAEKTQIHHHLQLTTERTREQPRRDGCHADGV